MASVPFQRLPLGFRFKPTDVELIDHYLRLKINGNDKEVSVIREIDVCKIEPWDLPDLSIIRTSDPEWFFFCPRDRKYPNGQRSNRATEAGYWKATGRDRKIVSKTMGLIGTKKTLVFYIGRAPKGSRTHWVIHEYRTTLKELDGSHPGQGAFVLCRLFKKDDDKKQDENDDGSNCDEGDTLASSPDAAKGSGEELHPEPAAVEESPVSVRLKVENCAGEVSDMMPSAVSPEEDSQLQEALNYFYDPQEPPFLPQFTHMESGEADDVGPSLPSGFNNGCSAMALQKMNEKDVLSDFLDSVLNNSGGFFFGDIGTNEAWSDETASWVNTATSGEDVFPRESGSLSGSCVEITNGEKNLAFMKCADISDHDNQHKGNQHLMQNPALLDDDIFSDASLERFCDFPYTIDDPSVNYMRHMSDSSRVESVIKIRTHAHEQLPFPPVFMEQGAAKRRIRLQITPGLKRPNGPEPTVTGDGGKNPVASPGNEIPTAMRVYKHANFKKQQKPWLFSILMGYAQMLRNVHLRSYGVVARGSISPLRLLRVVIVAVLFMIFAAMCIPKMMPVTGKLRF